MVAEKSRLVRHFCQRWLPEVAAGRLKPVIDNIYGLTDVAHAHAHLAASQHFGKVVLDICDATAVAADRFCRQASEEGVV